MQTWPLPRLVAHRCGGLLAPENTLIGLELSHALGVRGVEFDVMLSGDGSPVLIHDETLERTTDGTGRVSEAPDAALRALDAGRWHSARFAGERIPRFEDAILRCRALGLVANVEIKPAAGYAAATGRAVAEWASRGWAGAGDDRLPVLSSFDPAALKAAADCAPALPRALLFDRVPADAVSRVAELGATGVVCNTRWLTAAQADNLRGAGLSLAVYTENDPARVAPLLAMGVQSIITDRPDLLAAHV